MYKANRETREMLRYVNEQIVSQGNSMTGQQSLRKKVVLGMREKQEASDPRVFKKGEVIITTSGDYDDYCITGSFIVNRDFHSSAQLNLWASSLGVEVEDDEVECRNSEDAGDKGFMSWLAGNDYVTEVKYHEIGLPEEWATNSTRLL